MNSAVAYCAALAMIVITAIVLIVIVVNDLRQHFEFLRAEQTREAMTHLRWKTKGFFFYDYPLIECLQAGVARKLYKNGLGDFTKQIAGLALCALETSENPPIVYYWWEEEPNDPDSPFKHPNGHYKAILRYYCEGKWWQFDPCHELNIHTLESVKYGDNEVLLGKNYERLDFWAMPRGERHILEDCKEPKNSELKPELQYVETNSFAEYAMMVRVELDNIMLCWHNRDRKKA